jgi:hypothetical protein
LLIQKEAANKKKKKKQRERVLFWDGQVKPGAISGV